MFKFRQADVKKKAVQLWTAAAVIVFYIILPNLVHAADCVTSGSGSACTG
ncbi:MAG: hypothetical protein H6667_23585 [Ardenticatenaceae bacterium]|nr:hypothetical protein [Ardenticatenaceae bacterium]